MSPLCFSISVIMCSTLNFSAINSPDSVALDAIARSNESETTLKLLKIIFFSKSNFFSIIFFSKILLLYTYPTLVNDINKIMAVTIIKTVLLFLGFELKLVIFI